MNKVVLSRRLDHVLAWIEYSIKIQNGNGSTAYYHLFRGWERPYPETTGYLIPTLIDAGKYLQRPDLLDLCEQQARWLISMQNHDGSFPAGLDLNDRPVIFDIGQILLGLVAMAKEKPGEDLNKAIIKCSSWLFETLSDKNTWSRHCYKEGYIPAYHTRVIWPLLLARETDLITFNDTWALERIDFLLEQTYEDHWKPDFAFSPEDPAFTHTIAYTLRGLLESALILNHSTYLEMANTWLDNFIRLEDTHGTIAGAYQKDWEGDYSFICVPGHAQLALCALRVYAHTGIDRYMAFANRRTKEILNAQWRIGWKGIRGGIPGSLPVYGKYMPWRFLNWGAKFYADLLLWYLG